MADEVFHSFQFDGNAEEGESNFDYHIRSILCTVLRRHVALEWYKCPDHDLKAHGRVTELSRCRGKQCGEGQAGKQA